MDWRDWELFCEVVEHGGFSAAARAIGHPKSSLSAAVQRLECNLGLRLIERTTRHLRLTDAGENIYRRVRPLFIALHETRSEAMAMSSAIAGTLRIKLPVEKARLISSNAHIRLQAALAGYGVLRVTASYTRAAVEAGLLQRILQDHVCEPLSVHALLPTRQFVPAKVRCFLEALETQAHSEPGRPPAR
jgi:DNA-binding transcriptional LysR family regulator